jgi:hypothetical protein
MKSAFTRTGKRTFKGKIDDVKKAGQRAYIQKFKVQKGRGKFLFFSFD